MLDIANLEVVYNDVILVLRGLSLTVPDGEIVALLGSNGAGKTTTLRAISGLLDVHDGKITKGSVTFDGERIDGLDTAAIVRRGIKQVMEGRRVFAEMTVDENLTAGGYTNRNRATVATAHDRVMTLFPRLAERRKQVAGYLSGGEQQMLAIARGADDRSQAARPRRAVAGPRPAARPADPRHHRRHQPAGHERPADRAERGDGPVDRHHRLHHGDRQGGDGRPGREAAQATRTSRSSTSVCTATATAVASRSATSSTTSGASGGCRERAQRATDQPTYAATQSRCSTSIRSSSVSAG